MGKSTFEYPDLSHIHGSWCPRTRMQNSIWDPHWKHMGKPIFKYPDLSHIDLPAGKKQTYHGNGIIAFD